MVCSANQDVCSAAGAKRGSVASLRRGISRTQWPPGSPRRPARVQAVRHAAGDDAAAKNGCAHTCREGLGALPRLVYSSRCNAAAREGRSAAKFLPRGACFAHARQTPAARHRRRPQGARFDRPEPAPEFSGLPLRSGPGGRHPGLHAGRWLARRNRRAAGRRPGGAHLHRRAHPPAGPIATGRPRPVTSSIPRCRAGGVSGVRGVEMASGSRAGGRCRLEGGARRTGRYRGGSGSRRDCPRLRPPDPLARPAGPMADVLPHRPPRLGERSGASIRSVDHHRVDEPAR